MANLIEEKRTLRILLSVYVLGLPQNGYRTALVRYARAKMSSILLVKAHKAMFEHHKAIGVVHMECPCIPTLTVGRRVRLDNHRARSLVTIWEHPKRVQRNPLLESIISKS